MSAISVYHSWHQSQNTGLKQVLLTSRTTVRQLNWFGGGGGGGEGDLGKGLRCGNVPVENNVNRFLSQKPTYIYLNPIPLVRSTCTIKPEKSVKIIYTSQNIKPLHRTVGSPMGILFSCCKLQYLLHHHPHHSIKYIKLQNLQVKTSSNN